MKRLLARLAFFLAPSLAAIAQTVDTVGYPAFTTQSSNVAVGNCYQVTTSTRLTNAEIFLYFTGVETLTFTVHASTGHFGTYSEVFRRSLVVNPAASNWYSSGAIDVPLDAGHYYIIAVSFSGVGSYYFTIGNWKPVSFGWAVHGFQLGPGPLPAQFSSTVNPVIVYHQRLTTSAVGPAISTYCTSGSTTNACFPEIAAAGSPSASAGSGFTVSVNHVEGQRTGLFFYGLDNSGFTPVPWGVSSSYLCVKPPTQRSLPQSSGGTLDQCDGTLALDWNAFIASKPTALGNPFAAGDTVYVQGWFRDPPSAKHTMLSNGLQFVVGP